MFDGVTAIKKEHFDLVNGFSNIFWASSDEGNDMYDRLEYYKLTPIYRPLEWLGRYTRLSLDGESSPIQENQLVYRGLAEHGWLRSHVDGLTSLTYERLAISFKPLYIHILVDIGKPEWKIDC